jgi:hypothetical protein
MSEALRFNEGKPSLSYILQFVNPIKAVARIMEFGATKYEDGNWRKGGKPDREYLDSMMRHITSWLGGEVYDTDSGCSHLGHAIWNLLALHELNHPDEIMDDEVFKKQCEYWKRKKAENEIATKQLGDLSKSLPCAKAEKSIEPVEGASKVPEPLGILYDINWEPIPGNLDERDKPQDGIDLFVPAECCTDDTPLQENTMIGEIEPAQWQLDLLKGNQQECACGDCSGDCENGCENKSITFEIKDMDKSKSFQMLEKDYIYPAMLKMAKDADCAWLKAYDDYFQHLEEEYGE